MNQRQACEVLLAGGGVVLAVSELPDLGLAFSMLEVESLGEYTEELSRAQAVYWIGSVLFTIACGVALVLARSPIARALFPECETQTPEAEQAHLQAALLSAVGAYLAVVGLSVLLQACLVRDPRVPLSNLWPGVTGPVLQSLAGIGLFFGAKGLSGVWTLARSTGRERD
jgi:Na+-driven multidrug efflux pump